MCLECQVTQGEQAIRKVVEAWMRASQSGDADPALAHRFEPSASNRRRIASLSIMPTPLPASKTTSDHVAVRRKADLLKVEAVLRVVPCLTAAGRAPQSPQDRRGGCQQAVPDFPGARAAA